MVGPVCSGLLVECVSLALGGADYVEVVCSRVGGFVKFVNHTNKIIVLPDKNCSLLSIIYHISI